VKLENVILISAPLPKIEAPRSAVFPRNVHFEMATDPAKISNVPVTARFSQNVQFAIVIKSDCDSVRMASGNEFASGKHSFRRKTELSIEPVQFSTTAAPTELSDTVIVENAIRAEDTEMIVALEHVD
jgi:hypothetical protein